MFYATFSNWRYLRIYLALASFPPIPLWPSGERSSQRTKVWLRLNVQRCLSVAQLLKYSTNDFIRHKFQQFSGSSFSLSFSTTLRKKQNKKNQSFASVTYKKHFHAIRQRSVCTSMSRYFLQMWWEVDNAPSRQQQGRELAPLTFMSSDYIAHLI